jgi:hypothetical protein
MSHCTIVSPSKGTETYVDIGKNLSNYVVSMSQILIKNRRCGTVRRSKKVVFPVLASPCRLSLVDGQIHTSRSAVYHLEVSIYVNVK